MWSITRLVPSSMDDGTVVWPVSSGFHPGLLGPLASRAPKAPGGFASGGAPARHFPLLTAFKASRARLRAAA
jgi:hypothetical protein